MILLDTNIISELMKPVPFVNVVNWIDQQEVTHLFISTISCAEISYGLNTLVNGKRRRLLENAFDHVIMTAFQHRILSFDLLAAHLYGKIMGRRKQLGQPLNMLDGQIAAIASANNCTIATRNTRDFTNCEIDLINPFN